MDYIWCNLYFKEKKEQDVPKVQPELYQLVNDIAEGKVQPVQYSANQESSAGSANQKSPANHLYAILGAIGGVVLITLLLGGVLPFIRRRQQQRHANKDYTGIQEYTNLVFEDNTDEA